MKFAAALASTFAVAAAWDGPCSDQAKGGYDPLAMSQGTDGADGWRTTWDWNKQQQSQCLSCKPEYNPPGNYKGPKARNGRCGAADSETCDYPAPGIPSTQYPNGFRNAVVYMDNEPPFCLNVQGSRNAAVMVLVETEVPNQRLCIKAQNDNPVALNGASVLPDQCDEGQIHACFIGDANANELGLFIYCDESCPEDQINFKYKVDFSINRDSFNGDSVYNEDSAVRNVDMWCAMQNGEPELMWPSELTTANPPGFVPEQYLNLMNGAQSVAPTAAAVLLLAAGVVAAL